MPNLRTVERETDQLETPPWLFDHFAQRFRFTIDACASHENYLVWNHWTLEDDALTQDWSSHHVWCNPPYSNPGPFLQKAATAASAVCLVKGDPSTQWWNKFVKGKAQVLWLPKRVKFYLNGEPTAHSASFPSAALLYGFIPNVSELR